MVRRVPHCFDGGRADTLRAQGRDTLPLNTSMPRTQGAPVFDPNLLEGKRILVTGGGSGLGLSMSRAFARHGARVAIVGRSEARLLEGAAEIDSTGERVLTHVADVRDPEAVEATVAAVHERWGGVDVLVNNAAGNFLAPTEDLSARAFDAVVRIVLYGTFHMTQAVGRRMIESGEGGLVLNILATYAWTGSAFVVPSAAAKAGVLAMTRSLAVEWAAYGIRLNAIAPGTFPTEGAGSRLMPTPELQREALERVPLGRFGEHDELENLALFMVSDAAPYLNGECVTIDGGSWMGSGGIFNGLTRPPREDVKAALRSFRPR
jgi:NAD(P)-dependent dehydrogenase (short-subunit alcohol dehydrogenase family)